RDLTPFHERGEREARFHALAVHKNRAGTALAQAAAFLRACEVQVLAQRVEQGGARIERKAVLGSVHAQYNADRSGCRAGALRGGVRRAPRQEWRCGQSAAGSRREIQEFWWHGIEGRHGV